MKWSPKKDVHCAQCGWAGRRSKVYRACPNCHTSIHMRLGFSQAVREGASVRAPNSTHCRGTTKTWKSQRHRWSIKAEPYTNSPVRWVECVGCGARSAMCAWPSYPPKQSGPEWSRFTYFRLKAITQAKALLRLREAAIRSQALLTRKPT